MLQFKIPSPEYLRQYYQNKTWLKLKVNSRILSSEKYMTVSETTKFQDTVFKTHNLRSLLRKRNLWNHLSFPPNGSPVASTGTLRTEPSFFPFSLMLPSFHCCLVNSLVNLLHGLCLSVNQIWHKPSVSTTPNNRTEFKHSTFYYLQTWAWKYR